MARIKQKGKSGAAKAYVTRSTAVKKLQCSLADFRRLCILKGIFPREPRHKKRANKGNSAPTTFYYAKDITYLAHEPVLQKLREHKAFAKKLSRALGRGEWSSAKSLEDNKPVYNLDHIIKERYPTFVDALRDIDDALCMAFMFASLPSNDRIPPSLIENCAKLAAEWQLYVMQTKALRKIFLSIKGVYYQAEVNDQTITWVVPYQFTQTIPPDVDARVMLTFLELYQTLLGFVFFKLYTDAGLVYPPPLDAKKDEGAAGINAFALQEEQKVTVKDIPQARAVEITGKRVSTKDVRQTIRTIAGASDSSPAEVTPVHTNDADDHMLDEEFVLQPSKADTDLPADLPTLHTLAGLPQSSSSTLFASCVFWLSRETSRPIFEFVVRSFGGRIGWPASSGHGSPYEEDDPAITHVIIDRPMVDRPTETEKQRELRGLRKFVQPQWIVDSINAGKLLVEESYLQGKTLPPHLSPFATYDGGYDPTAANVDEDMQDISDDEDEEVDVGEDGDRTAEDAIAANVKTALAEDNPAALRTAELEAEAAGVDFNTFETQVSKLAKKHKPKASTTAVEDNPNKMLMSNKQRKLYERMKHSQSKSNTEREKLQQRKHKLDKDKRKASS